MRSHSEAGTAPADTRRSVPRLTPLHSIRTRASPGLGGPSGFVRSSATPGFVYQSERAICILPVERRAVMCTAPMKLPLRERGCRLTQPL